MADDDKRAEDLTDPKPDDVAEAEIVELRSTPDRPVTAPVERRRGGAGTFLGLVAGGALAAGAGFGLAQYLPGGWPLQQGTADLDAQLAAQAEQINALKASLADLAARPAPDVSAEVAALRAEIDTRLAQIPEAADPAALIETAATSLEADISALDARLTEVEKRPAGSGGGVSSTALTAYDRELKALRDEVAAQGGVQAEAAARIEAAAAEAEAKLSAAGQEAEKLKTEAEATARSIAIAAALSRIRAAYEVGGPFGSAVTDLDAAGVEVPADLSALSETGVSTQAELEASFPAAARDALEAALRGQVGDSWGSRLTSFLRTQTGARSLEPREGTDPDAILSRAEAALRSGDLPAALTEIATLPEPARAALADWVAMAQSRETALAAIDALSATADTN